MGTFTRWDIVRGDGQGLGGGAVQSTRILVACACNYLCNRVGNGGVESVDKQNSEDCMNQPTEQACLVPSMGYKPG